MSEGKDRGDADPHSNVSSNSFNSGYPDPYLHNPAHPNPYSFYHSYPTTYTDTHSIARPDAHTTTQRYADPQSNLHSYTRADPNATSMYTVRRPQQYSRCPYRTRIEGYPLQERRV